MTTTITGAPSAAPDLLARESDVLSLAEAKAIVRDFAERAKKPRRRAVPMPSGPRGCRCDRPWIFESVAHCTKCGHDLRAVTR